jgi:RNA polymerase sigma-70 factor (ECF subfamily)
MAPTDTDPRAELVSMLPRLRRFAYGLTHDGPLADDLVQAACLKALERWHQWQAGTSLAAWMFRIVQTTWLDDYRARKRQRTDALDDDTAPELPGEDGRVVVEQRSQARQLHVLVEALPDDPRAVLLMVTVDGLSYKDAAAALGVPVGTVMSRLSRARLRLADGLGGER